MTDTAPKKKRVRNRHIPTTKTCKIVQDAVNDGLNMLEMGKLLGISAVTVKRYYAKELEHYAFEATAPAVYQVNPTDRKIVENLCLAGYPVEEIADTLGVVTSTVKKYYDDILKNHRRIKLGRVTDMMFEQALSGECKTNGNAIFLLKTLLRDRFGDTSVQDATQNLTELMKEVYTHLPD